MRTTVGYVALCLLAPLLWGVVSAHLFDWWQARRGGSGDASSREPEGDVEDMYHI